jgi:hypothetical protein
VRSPGNTLLTPRPLLRSDGASALRSLAGWQRAVVLGLAITLGQVLFGCLLSGRPFPGDAYGALAQWDSQWYAAIAEQGYLDRLPVDQVPADWGRVGFFPGFPLFVRLVLTVSPLSSEYAVVLAAQLACWGFWAYVLLFAQRWHLPTSLTALGAAAILVHPSAFFLVAGYSESLFLAAVLGFLYWSSRGDSLGWWLALAHGLVMTSTRIVGVPLVVCPVVLALVHQAGSRRRLLPSGLLAAGASLGALLFFAFCQVRYGRWDFYMFSQRTFWHVEPNYLALFTTDIYRVQLPQMVNGSVNPNELSRLCVPWSILCVIVLLLVERKLARVLPDSGWRTRLPFYLSGGLMLYIAISGLANSGLLSMIRYSFCVHVMLCLAVVHLLPRVPALPPLIQRAGVALAALAALVSVTFQVMLTRLFTAGEWVA